MSSEVLLNVQCNVHGILCNLSSDAPFRSTTGQESNACVGGVQLLVNYGIVEENNPHDKLIITATIPNSDPLFKEKRAALQPAMAKLATQQPFDLTPKACPPLGRRTL